MNDNKVDIVFVYGTLMAGDTESVRSDVLPEYGARFLSCDSARGLALFSVAGGAFPAAVPSADNRCVVYGEVWALPSDETARARCVALLDAIEGHPRFYCRQPIDTEEGHRAWVYVLAGESENTMEQHAQRIPNGDWRAFQRSVRKRWKAPV